MKRIIAIFSFLLLIGCGTDDNGDTIGDISITVNEISLSSAKITWTPPTNTSASSITYKVILNGEVIEENYPALFFIFTGLSSDSDYTGSVYALDSDGNETSANFTFSTLINPIRHYPGILRLTQQTEVDTLSYTGMSGLELVGNDIHDVTNLSQITVVVRSIKIDNTLLENLDGLQNIRSYPDTYTTELTIQNNSVLNNISGINNFSKDCIDITIDNNTDLSDISDFIIDPWGKYLTINNIPATDFSNFSDFRRASEFTLSNLSGTALDGFTSLEDVYKMYLINISGSNIQGFSSLQEVTVLTMENVSVSDLSAFTNLTTISRIELKDMANLTTLNGLQNTNIGGLLLDGNVPLQNMSHWPDQTTIGLTLKNMPLNDLSLFSNFSNMGIRLENMYNLTDLSGLDNLTYCGGIGLYNNQNIVSLDGAPNIAGGTSGGVAFFAENNPNLVDYCGVTTWMNNTSIYIDYTYSPPEILFNTSGNAYNPTEIQIESPTDCSL